MYYATAGQDSDITLLYSGTGVFQIGAMYPNGQHYFCSVADIPSVLNKMEYLKKQGCKIPARVFEKLLQQFHDLIDEHREDPY